MRYARIIHLHIICMMLVSLTANAFESDLSIAGGDATISWPSVSNKQYQVYSTNDLTTPRSNWDEVGTWFAGDGSTLSVDETLSTLRFYFVEERDEFVIDVAGAGYGTLANSWTYEIIDSREGNVPYEATYTVDGTQTFNSQQVIRVLATSPDHPSVANWEQTLYILDDFSDGLYQVGGINPTSAAATNFNSGPFTITSANKWPLLFNTFTPGLAVTDEDYTHSNFGAVDNTITHDIVSVTLPGETEPRDGVRVTSVFTATVIQVVVYNVTSTTVDIYVDDVGLVSKTIDVVATGLFPVAPVNATVTLKSYTQAP